MKNVQITLATFIILFTLQSNAQISVNVNLGSRPQYHDRYENEVSYYFLPEIEAYFDIQAQVYIFNSPRGWVRSSYLPEYCRNYDINRGHRVALTYIGYTPYADFKFHKQKYYRENDRNYREEYYYNRNNGRNEYVTYSNYNDNKYYKNKGHHGNKYGNKHYKQDDCD